MVNSLLLNPYTPGAGKVPSYLAGRDQTINDVGKMLLHIKHNKVPQSVIYYGLRGVGKTVLLNTIEDISDEHNILHQHIEVSDKIRFKHNI